MELQAGATILHYRLAEAIGEGGMGAVWRATDTKLGRDVAIKVLPEALEDDAERRARFEREAKVLASLNHANVATLFGLEEADGRHLLVMELVEGEDLAARIERSGPIPLDHALPIALQIAEGIEAAHEGGVVHRDLKPANVMIGPDGVVKVLDFGLASALEPTGGNTDLSLSPTITAQMTQAGVILGTAAYMSPEQARGQAVDKRSDIWAFGVVLYQILSGESCFGGDTVTDVLASIVKEQPDWDRVAEPLPPRLRQLLDRMLDKDPRTRLRDIGEARVTLEKLIAGDDGQSEPVPTDPPSRPRWPWVAGAAIFAVAAIAVTSMLTRSSSIDLPLRKFPIAMDHTDPSRAIGFDPQVSPDGRYIVYVSHDQLWLRDLASTEPHPIAGTEGATRPFWSPDSEWIGFGTDNAINKIDRAGGAAAVIAAVTSGQALSSSSSAVWDEDGTIIYGTGSTGLFRVSSRGGTVTEFIAPGEGAIDLHQVCRLPEGRGWVAVRHGDTGYGDLELLTPDGTRKIIHHSPGKALGELAWSPSGHIIFRDDGPVNGIWALPFSLNELEVTGDAFLVAGGGRYPSVSDDGTLIYVAGLRGTAQELVRLARDGSLDRVIAEIETTRPYPDLSPDDTKIVLTVNTDEGREVRVFDTIAGTERRLSLDDKRYGIASWHPDGQRIFAFEEPSNDGILFFLDGRRPEPIAKNTSLARFTPDGADLVYSRPRDDSFAFDIWRRSMTGDDPVDEELVARSTIDWDPMVSPDGRFMVYAGNESGRFEIYLTTYPKPESTWQVSRDGGEFPRWSDDGREIFFTTRNQIWAVDIDTSAGVTLGRPHVLFDRPTTNFDPQWADGFSVTSDGQNFVLIRAKIDDDSSRPSIVVTQNWFREFSGE